MKKLLLWVLSLGAALLALLALIGGLIFLFLNGPDGWREPPGWLFLLAGLAALAFAFFVNPRAPKTFSRLAARRTRVIAGALCILVGFAAVIPAFQRVMAMGERNAQTSEVNDSATIVQYGLAHGMSVEDFHNDKAPTSEAIQSCLTKPEITAKFLKAAKADGELYPEDSNALEYIIVEYGMENSIMGSRSYGNREIVVAKALAGCVKPI